MVLIANRQTDKQTMSQVVIREYKLQCTDCDYTICCKSEKSRDMLGRLHRKKCKKEGRTVGETNYINNGLKKCSDSIELQKGDDVIMEGYKCRLMTTLNVKVK